MEAEYDPAADEEIAQQAPQTPGKKEKNNTMKNKRRFSDEQIRLLESIFETETKLEPRKKLQLARELGLQPRQVAIWFQNRRARWKSKQIEQDYRILKANYDSLATRFESLKKERQSLILQTQKLRELWLNLVTSIRPVRVLMEVAKVVAVVQKMGIISVSQNLKQKQIQVFKRQDWETGNSSPYKLETTEILNKQGNQEKNF